MCNPIITTPPLHHAYTRFNAGPEHGFRGAAQAGHAGSNTIDPQTNLSVYNIYGSA